MSRRARLLTAALLLGLAATSPAAANGAGSAVGEAPVQLSEFRLSEQVTDELRRRWIDQLEDRYGVGTWAPMRMELSDADLELMGLPPRAVLAGQRFDEPTMVSRDGTRRTVSSAHLATFAGTGYLGIRPGAWLLLLDGGSVGWCSLAHVHGSPGSYAVTTAGHCGKNGDRATVIAAMGDQGVPVLLDFGRFKASRDGGIGNDYAFIPVEKPYQHLVTPTMAFWGGPRGVFTKTGAVAGYQLPNNGLVPSVSVDPDPFLAQQVVHYGHGAGVGAGGTPRSGTAVHWGSRHFAFFGAIAPGDSGSGSNTLTGDTVGATMEAAGINTHLYLDGSGKTGLGLMAGTRTTVVGTPTDGQLVGYPAPAPLLP